MNRKKTYKDLKKYIKLIRRNSIDFKFDLLSFDKYSLAYITFLGLSINQFIQVVYFKNINDLIINAILLVGFILSGLSIIKNQFKKIMPVLIMTGLTLCSILVINLDIQYLPIYLVAIIFPIKQIFRNSKIKTLSSFYLFEEDGLKGCNLIIKDITPIKGFKNLTKIKIKLNEELILDDINEFNNNLLLHCDKMKDIFIGFKYLKYKLTYEVYIYRDNSDNKALIKFLDNNINYEYEIKNVNDKNYKYYYEKICPSDKLFMHMCNKNIIDNRLPETVNLFEEQSLILVLSFKNKEEALQCREDLYGSKEYVKIDYDDNAKHVIENNLSEDYNNMLYIEQKTRIGLSKINMITDKMFDYAKKYNGTFEEWGLGTLTKEEEN